MSLLHFDSMPFDTCATTYYKSVETRTLLRDYDAD